MILLEAMATGCPVVSTDVGGVAELIEDGVSGRLYRLGDVSAAAAAIAGIGSDLGRTADMTARARQIVLDRHSMSAVAERYVQLLDQIAPRQTRTPARRATIPDENVVPGLVSVIIPVYNRPALVRQAVASVRAQTYGSTETIPVDDGSDQPTAALCDQFAASNPTIRVLHIDHIGRAGLVREAGRVASAAEFIQYLDSDDLLAPRKLEVMVGALRQHPDADIAYSYIRRYQILAGSHLVSPPSGVAKHIPLRLNTFLTHSFWQTACPLFMRRITDLAGPWNGPADLGGFRVRHAHGRARCAPRSLPGVPGGLPRSPIRPFVTATMVR